MAGKRRRGRGQGAQDSAHSASATASTTAVPQSGEATGSAAATSEQAAAARAAAASGSPSAGQSGGAAAASGSPSAGQSGGAAAASGSPSAGPSGGASAAASGSSSAGQSGGASALEQVAQKMAGMNMKGNVPPETRLPVRKGERPLFPGTQGRPVQLVTNHFPISLTSKKEIYVYDIKIQPPWSRPYRKRDTEIYLEVFKKWKENCPQVENPKAWVFNGNNIIYSTQDIPSIPDMEGIQIPGETKELEFAVRNVRRCLVIDVRRELELFNQSGRRSVREGNEAGVPQEVLNALDTVLSQVVRTSIEFTCLGRSFFHITGRVLDVGFGKEVWIGTFTSVRPFWKQQTAFPGAILTLNADVSNKPAVKNLHLINRPSYIEAVLPRSRLDFTQGLQERDIEELERDLKGLKVSYTLPDGSRRCYRVNKIVDLPRNLIIPDLKISVQQYFMEKYKIKLRYPNLPCLHVGALQKSIFIPMEFCSVEKQPLPRGKKLNESSTSQMIRHTATRPDERKGKILEGLMRNSRIYQEDPFALEFGISVACEMAQISGRVLPSPTIQYQDKLVNITSNKPGSWWGSKYVSGKSLDSWAILDLRRAQKGPDDIVRAFTDAGRTCGLAVSQNVTYQRSSERTIERDFENVVHSHRNRQPALKLIMLLFPFKNAALYAKVKYLGDIKHKIPTQCSVESVLFKGNVINRTVVSNLCLKINSKLGGVNHLLAPNSRPPCLDRPTMIMGADVSHAAPEHKGEKPSIAAVVGSMDPKALTLYECEIRVQNAAQNEEIIQDMKDITKRLLLKFHGANGYKPGRIIMFRDGVSEGQFLKVLRAELAMMYEAWKELEKGVFDHEKKHPPLQITYIVVQKRHHTRFFPTDRNCYEKNGNVLAGTVVDQGINHPTEGDFYLVSHEGIQGTSRPTHYQVLWDDCLMSADELEKLTFYLCHLYSRCTRSVSYPTPTYYAHLAADRARKHHNTLLERRDRDSSRTLKEQNAKIMYFV